MKKIIPKKSLGQHFLNDKGIAAKIVAALKANDIQHVVEVGPGMGALTPLLLQEKRFDTRFVEIDANAVEYLKTQFPAIKDKLIMADFLQHSHHFPHLPTVFEYLEKNLRRYIVWEISDDGQRLMAKISI